MTNGECVNHLNSQAFDVYKYFESIILKHSPFLNSPSAISKFAMPQFAIRHSTIRHFLLASQQFAQLHMQFASAKVFGNDLSIGVDKIVLRNTGNTIFLRHIVVPEL